MQSTEPTVPTAEQWLANESNEQAIFPGFYAGFAAGVASEQQKLADELQHAKPLPPYHVGWKAGCEAGKAMKVQKCMETAITKYIKERWGAVVQVRASQTVSRRAAKDKVQPVHDLNGRLEAIEASLRQLGVHIDKPKKKASTGVAKTAKKSMKA